MRNLFPTYGLIRSESPNDSVRLRFILFQSELMSQVYSEWFRTTRVKRTSLGKSLAGSHAYNPIRDSWRDSWRDFLARKVLPTVWPRVLPRVLLRVLPRLSVRLLARLLTRLFAPKSLAKSLGESLGSDYMHDSRRDSFRDSFFLRGQSEQNSHSVWIRLIA